MTEQGLSLERSSVLTAVGSTSMICGVQAIRGIFGSPTRRLSVNGSW
jgi:hypothetical protein